jgi:hypothetical protein
MRESEGDMGGKSNKVRWYRRKDMKELAERAVKAKGWRWLPGMRCTHRWMSGIRVLVDESGEQSESYIVLPDADGNAVVTLHDCGIMGGFPRLSC